MSKRIVVLTVVFCLLSLGAFAASSITVGSVTGGPGGTVVVPVQLNSDQALAGVNVRLDYDETILEEPSAVRGSLLAASHAMDYYSPQAGKLNVVAYGSSGATAFGANSGVIFNLRFKVKDGASLGAVANINFAAEIAGPPTLPGSGVATAAGASVAHTPAPGSVTVSGSALVPNQYAYVAAPGPFQAGAWDYAANEWRGFLNGSGDAGLGYVLTPGQWAVVCPYDYSQGKWTEGMYLYQDIWNTTPAPRQVKAASQMITAEPREARAASNATQAGLDLNQEFTASTPGNMEVKAWNYVTATWTAETTGVNEATLTFPAPYENWLVVCVYNVDAGKWMQGLYVLRWGW